MKYIIDVEKIKGTNLWKAKNFNTLVFDENGLNKMYILDEDIQEKEIKKWRQKYCNANFQRERLDFLSEEQECRIYKLQKKLNDEISKKEHWRNTASKQFLKIEKLREKLKWEQETVADRCTSMVELAKEKKELEKKIEELENKLPCEEKVPAEVVCETKKEELHLVDRNIKKLKHTIKTQKGVIKKQGKEISELQKVIDGQNRTIEYWGLPNCE